MVPPRRSKHVCVCVCVCGGGGVEYNPQSAYNLANRI